MTTNLTYTQLQNEPLVGEAEADRETTGRSRRGVEFTEEQEAALLAGQHAPKKALIERERFQVFIGLVIFANIVVLWGETDAPDFVIWEVCDHIFLVIFVIEIILRVRHHTLPGYIKLAKGMLSGDQDGAWAVLDVFLVVAGIFDLWIVPFFLHESEEGEEARSLRMLRLMRLLRLLRVFNLIPQMKKFAQALQSMSRQFVWIFVVLLLFILSTAIAVTPLLGRGEALGGGSLLEQGQYAEDFRKISTAFSDFSTSAFTLFQLTTQDNWDGIAIPIVTIDSRWRFFFYAFIGFESWTMISILTAVASNSMIEATSDRKEKEAEMIERKNLMFIEFLRETFLEADQDENGLLDKEEFSALIEREFVHRTMKDMGIHFTQEELMKAWDMLDIDGSGEVTIDEFVTGFTYLQEGLSTKHFVNVDYSLKRVGVRFEKRMQKVRALVNEIMQQNEQILAKLQSQDRTRHKLNPTLQMYQRWAASSEFNEYEQARQRERDADRKKHAQIQDAAGTGSKSSALIVTSPGSSPRDLPAQSARTVP